MMVAANAVAVWKAYWNQGIMVLLMNVPTVSFGLAMGWVSLTTGEHGSPGASSVVAASITFVSALLSVPLAAKALHYGRKFAIIATSFVFATCWALKLCGDGWWIVIARAMAGVGGTAAWAITPLLAREICSPAIRGAAVSALVLAHNFGFLLMYLAADSDLKQSTVLWICLALSLGHCLLFLLMPESPAFLAAKGNLEAARRSLAWLRGTTPDDEKLKEELKDLPPLDDPTLSPLKVFTNLIADPQRKRALIIGALAVIGQEICGVLALLQFAERVFVITLGEGSKGSIIKTTENPIVSDVTTSTDFSRIGTSITDSLNNKVPATTFGLMETIARVVKGNSLATTESTKPFLDVGFNYTPNASNTVNVLEGGRGNVSSVTRMESNAGVGQDANLGGLVTPARHAVVLGTVQFIASGLALYLVERVGRRPLIISTALITGGCLAAGALAMWLGGDTRDAVVTAALAGAVAADSAGLQPAPYALLADMFHYEYRGCAIMVATAGACAGNALEVIIFPLVASAGGLGTALALSAILTLSYAVFAAMRVPETRKKTPEEIYEALGPISLRKTPALPVPKVKLEVYQETKQPKFCPIYEYDQKFVKCPEKIATRPIILDVTRL